MFLAVYTNPAFFLIQSQLNCNFLQCLYKNACNNISVYFRLLQSYISRVQDISLSRAVDNFWHLGVLFCVWQDMCPINSLLALHEIDFEAIWGKIESGDNHWPVSSKKNYSLYNSGPKIWGCWSTPKHLLVYGLETEIKERRDWQQERPTWLFSICFYMSHMTQHQPSLTCIISHHIPGKKH